MTKSDEKRTIFSPLLARFRFRSEGPFRGKPGNSTVVGRVTRLGITELASAGPARVPLCAVFHGTTRGRTFSISAELTTARPCN